MCESVFSTIKGSMQHSQGLRVAFNAWQNLPVKNQHASECMCTLQDRLELRSEQKQEMANLRKHFLQSLHECHEAREVICLGLQQVSESKPCITASYSSVRTGHSKGRN